MSVKIQHGVATVGDITEIEVTANETLTGKTLTLDIISPSGAIKTLSSPSISNALATFTTTATTFDEAGDWYAFMYDATVGKHYNKESGGRIPIRPKPADMAVAL